MVFPNFVFQAGSDSEPGLRLAAFWLPFHGAQGSDLNRVRIPNLCACVFAFCLLKVIRTKELNRKEKKRKPKKHPMNSDADSERLMRESLPLRLFLLVLSSESGNEPRLWSP